MRIKQGLMTRVSEPHWGMEVSPPPGGFKLIIASRFPCLPTHNPIIHQVTRLLCRKRINNTGMLKHSRLFESSKSLKLLVKILM